MKIHLTLTLLFAAHGSVWAETWECVDTSGHKYFAHQSVPIDSCRSVVDQPESTSPPVAAQRYECTDYAGRKYFDARRSDVDACRDTLAQPLVFADTPKAKLPQPKAKPPAIVVKTKAPAAPLTGVSIGMTSAEALATSWGKPSSVNRTINARGRYEQWVYGSRSYLYFDNDILTSIQN